VSRNFYVWNMGIDWKEKPKKLEAPNLIGFDVAEDAAMFFVESTDDMHYDEDLTEVCVLEDKPGAEVRAFDVRSHVTVSFSCRESTEAYKSEDADEEEGDYDSDPKQRLPGDEYREDERYASDCVKPGAQGPVILHLNIPGTIERADDEPEDIPTYDKPYTNHPESD